VPHFLILGGDVMEVKKIHERRPAPYPEPHPCNLGEMYWRRFNEQERITIYQCQCEPGEYPTAAIVGHIPTWDADFGELVDAESVADEIVGAVNSHDRNVALIRKLAGALDSIRRGKGHAPVRGEDCTLGDCDCLHRLASNVLADVPAEFRGG
jgi:hypothetical protein